MKRKLLLMLLFSVLFISHILAKNLKEADIPKTVKAAFVKTYPDARKINWEKERGNFEANWGGKGGENNSVSFTAAGIFIEIVEAIPVSKLPSNVASYVAKHYKGFIIVEAGKITDAAGKHMFEAEIKGKDVIFDEKGNFIKND